MNESAPSTSTRVDSEKARVRVGASAIAHVLQHPTLWFTALRQMFRLAPNGWWHRAPFLPLPDARYLSFRLETQYGDDMSQATGRDLVTYLAWCRAYQRELSRSRTGV